MFQSFYVSIFRKFAAKVVIFNDICKKIQKKQQKLQYYIIFCDIYLPVYRH
jgi:hypothetical protein